jgi:nucleotide-binding universal stress UspA family protein
MSDDANSAATAEVPHGAVIAGVVPGQSPRVLTEAARFARLFSVPLAVVYVDVTRFVTFEDPDAIVPAVPVDLAATAGAPGWEQVRAAASTALGGAGVEWSVHQLVGDPAMAMARLADRVDAELIVVGTRGRGFGESIREFFMGSVAARLSHRQRRSILVVPLGEPVPDDQEIVWE